MFFFFFANNLLGMIILTKAPEHSFTCKTNPMLTLLACLTDSLSLFLVLDNIPELYFLVMW